MKYAISSAVFTGTLFMALLVSCAQPPQKKLALAKAAIESAKAVGADTCAKPELASAKDLYDEALLEIHNEEKYSPVLRKYALVSSELDTVVTLAENAAIKAIEAKDRLRVASEKKPPASKQATRKTSGGKR